MSANTNPISERLLTDAQVGERYQISPLTARRWAQNGKIPRPVRKEKKFVRWREEDINRHIRELGNTGQ